MTEAGAERIQKVLAHAGVASRRAVEEMIEAGRIRVNGRAAQLGERVDPDHDTVELDGVRVPLRSDLAYYLMNKPEGVVTSAADERGRPTVLDFLDPSVRVYPVGRLDMGTEGALLLTNDGELTHRLTHPSFAVPKMYVAQVGGRVGGGALRKLRAGVELEDGPVVPSSVRVLEQGRHSALLEVTMTEGRNRVVRRMLEAVGHPVQRLVRTAIGPLALGRLKPGTVRRLSPAEIRELYRACGL